MARKLNKSQYDRLIKKLKSEGKLTASGVLAEAEDENSPLHELFEWDDAKAVREYRLIQARKVIKMVNIYIAPLECKIVHIPVIKGEGEYREAHTVVTNISDYEMALEDAYKRVRSAESALNILKDVALKESPDRAAILAVAMGGLKSVNVALDRLH